MVSLRLNSPAIQVSVLQCVALRRIVLQCAAECCHVLQRAAVCRVRVIKYGGLFAPALSCCAGDCAAVYCTILQCVAVCCNVLQCIAECCRVWQRDPECGTELQSDSIRSSLSIILTPPPSFPLSQPFLFLNRFLLFSRMLDCNQSDIADDRLGSNHTHTQPLLPHHLTHHSTSTLW